MEWNACAGTIAAFLLVLLSAYYVYNTTLYWLRKRVPGPVPLPFIGNFFPRWMGTMSVAEYDQRYYSNYGGKRFCGFFEFQTKSIMVGDPEILKHVLIKDFDHFINRSISVVADPIVDKMVLVLHDSMWKSVRSVLTPSFSSGKIRGMTPLVVRAAQRLLQQQVFSNEEQRDSEHEMSSLMRKFAMDTIATVAFGIEVSDLDQEEDKFTANARKIFVSLSRWQRFVFFFVQLFPRMAKLTNYRLRDESALRFFQQVIHEALEYRKKHGLKRNDFLDLLKDAQQKDFEEAEKNGRKPIMTEDVFLAQCIVFLAAGIDTVSTTIALCLHSLAFYPAIQDRVLNEIDKVLKDHNLEISYEALQDMKYLDMVLKETQRLYPSAPRTYRVCSRTYVLPGTDITLEPKTSVVIPIRCIHYDPEYYPDPTTFNPERFTPENNAKRNPMTFLTFGQGPRNCIGMRLANLEMKACIVSLLKDNRVNVCPKTRNPLVQDKLSGVLKISGGVWLSLGRRKMNQNTQD